MRFCNLENLGMKRCRHNNLRITKWATFIRCEDCNQLWEKFRTAFGTVWERKPMNKKDGR